MTKTFEEYNQELQYEVQRLNKVVMELTYEKSQMQEVIDELAHIKREGLER